MASRGLILALVLGASACASEDGFVYRFDLEDVDETIVSVTVDGETAASDVAGGVHFRYERTCADYDAARADPPRGLLVEAADGDTYEYTDSIFASCDSRRIGTVLELNIYFGFEQSQIRYGRTLCVGTEGEDDQIH